MQRPLCSFPLSSGQQARLKAAGFETTADLRDVGVVELSKELSISHTQALEILKAIEYSPAHPSAPNAQHDSNSSNAPPTARGRSALELFRVEQLQGYIVTFSAKIDGILGGGVPLGKITELCGAPGVGKTQFSMQLAVDATIPDVFGGVDGEAIYIDTEGSFIVERVADIAECTVQHLTKVAESSGEQEMMALARNFTRDKVLAGIHYFRCHDYLELVALVNILPEFVSQHPKVRLIVVDSIASPFRHGFEDMGLRNRILSGLAQNLIQLAALKNIAVVLTNQMTTKVNTRASGPAHLVPALGESWGHVSTIRMILFWSAGERYAMLYKSPNRKEATVPYQIMKEGVRDCILNQSPSTVEALSQLVSLTSSQMEELENSPEYDDDDDEREDIFGDEGAIPHHEMFDDNDDQQRDDPSVESKGDFRNASTIHGQGLEEHSIGVRSSEITQRRKLASQYQTGSVGSSRKRPHPDS